MKRIENLLVSNSEEGSHFKSAWSVPISNQVERKSKQFGNVETWLPIEAVLRYIVEKVVSLSHSLVPLGASSPLLTKTG